MTYNPGVPTGSIPLNQDYLNLQNNFTAADDIFGVNHIKFSNATAQKGYHTAIALVPQSPIPPAIVGYGQLYCRTLNDLYSTDQTLYYKTGGDLVTQLTRNFQPDASSNQGYTFLPGGLVFQWGFVNGTKQADLHFDPGDNGIVTFNVSNINFASTCFAVWAQPMYTSTGVPASTSASIIAIDRGFTNTAFSWKIVGSGGSYTRFFWFAIGR